MRTLAHLLWSDLEGFPKGDGPVHPRDYPSIGLPFRVAAFSLLEALLSPRHARLSTRPSSWTFTNSSWKALVSGRLMQLGIEKEAPPRFTNRGQLVEKKGSQKWPLPIHPAYRISFASSMALGNRPSTRFQHVWESALLFLTAIDGRERLLDRFVEAGPQAIRFAERWELRAEIPLPIVFWDWIETMFRVARTGSFRNSGWELMTKTVLEFLEGHFRNNKLILPEEFLAERVDVSLGGGDSPEFPCAIDRRKTTPSVDPFPEHFILGPAKSLEVRIAQITAELEWPTLCDRFPRLLRSEMQKIMNEILRTFGSPGGDGHGWEIAIFPEVTLPFRFRRRFQRLVAETGKAGLIGCIWHELPFAIQPLGRSPSPIHYLVNEALLSVPLGSQQHPHRVRSFLIRKPLPAHTETAFVQCLSEMTPTTGAWKLIPGRRIYRFIHPQWGDFTVAICSDIIDPVPWASLKGQILHLFLCSYNPDVNLFESMTWVRADENCVNLVATNCGHYGGSFAWSPRSAENRELARVRGNHVFVLADVSLPVKELLNWQKTGVSKSVAKELEKTWRDNEYPDAKFKAPPPQFPGRPG